MCLPLPYSEDFLLSSQTKLRRGAMTTSRTILFEGKENRKPLVPGLLTTAQSKTTSVPSPRSFWFAFRG